MMTAELHAVFANLCYHALDTRYAPALGITPLPEPRAERKQASLSSPDLRRQLAVPAVLAQAAGMRLATDVGPPAADAHAPARPGDMEAAGDFWASWRRGHCRPAPNRRLTPIG